MPFSPPPTPVATVTQQIGREERQHTASENFDKIAKKLSENFQRMPKAPTANSQGKLVLKRTSSMDTNNNTVIGIDDGELKPVKTPATMAFTIVCSHLFNHFDRIKNF